jgi:predicted outer membrane lipoprotein
MFISTWILKLLSAILAFGIVVAVTFENVFCLEIYQNNIF